MDERKLRELELEIENINRVQDEGEKQDTPDGFIKFAKKQLQKICILPRKYDKKPTGAASFVDRTKRSKVAGEGHEDSADVYDFSHPERGLAVIINNEDFSSTRTYYNMSGARSPDRPGSLHDALALYNTFQNLGFRVWLRHDLNDWEMVELLKLARKEYDHANADCFVCAILTHGAEIFVNPGNNCPEIRKDVLFGTNGKVVPIKTLVDIFSDDECSKLEGKPRLFFVQACRGEKYDPGVNITVTKPKEYKSENGSQSSDRTDHSRTQDESNRPHSNNGASSSSYSTGSQSVQTDTTDAQLVLGEEDIQGDLQNVNLNATSSGDADLTDAQWAPVCEVVLQPTPLYKDSLIMYATTPGYFAWRRDAGTWFIQSLCQVLDKPDIGETSLLNALVKVTGIVAREYESNVRRQPHKHQKKETPVIESMLVKDVFFTPK